MDQQVAFRLQFEAPFDMDKGRYTVRNKILAIKLLRECTGLGLKESKIVVEDKDGRDFLTSTSTYGLLVARLETSQEVSAKISDVQLVDRRPPSLIICP